ncbi:MAG TPA: TetR/AcrR family transcriptional regulator [Caulobacteraceae bacterium]|nr:TetR/AcrR family transcriptional regulator [Caulobacteraceae bacterium]
MTTQLANTDSPRSDAKRRAIIAVARDAFLARGYAATSMSEIATRLGGSKGTLYNYFRSKEELFEAFMVEICQGPAAEIFGRLPAVSESMDIRESLIDLGASLLEFLLREEMIALHRLVVAEAGRFPELGRMFYEAGPERGEVRFAEFFEGAIAAGLVRPADPKMMGQRLKDLVLSDVYLRRLWGVLAPLSAKALRAHVAESVDIFLRAFGETTA